MTRIHNGKSAVIMARALPGPLLAALLAALLTLFPCKDAPAEEIDRQMRDNALRDVQALTRYGNYDSALKRLEWLYANLPQDEAVVLSFFDFLVGRQDYERARDIMETYLEFRPAYVGGMAKLADLYFKTDETEKARALLERFIETGKDKAWAYEIAARTYIIAGFMDEALNVIARGRGFHKSNSLLYDEAAQVYMRTERYAEAVNEYLQAVEAGLLGPNVAGSRIQAVAAQPGAVAVIMPVLEEAAERNLAGLVPLTALWQLSMVDGDCARGLREVTRIVERDRGLIGVLVNAAREFERNECHGECAHAYGLAAELSETPGDVVEFLLARGRCQEAWGDMEGAAATYEDFISKYPDSERAFDAYFALARVLRDIGRCGEALVRADKAAQARAVKTARMAVLIKGDCLVRLERFDDAKEVYDLVRPDWDRAQAQAAYYNLGEIAVYEHDFDAALSYFNVVLKEYPGEALANDAVERLILIRGSKSGEAYAAELEVFADAALLERQGKPEDAIPLFRSTGAAGPEEVRVQSLKSLIRIYMAAGEYDQALEICRIAGEMKATHWSPVALETAGDIYLHLGRIEDAVLAYEDVIVRYPNSVSAGEARRKLYVVRKVDGE